MIEIEITGCPFQPLASYLKALAIMRLVAEQADDDARWRWNDRYFVLESELDRAALIDFFMTRYEPTPVLAPWNAGSGFYQKDRKVGIAAIRNSKEARFDGYRRDLKSAMEIIENAGGEKGESKTEEDKRRKDILRECRNRLSDRCVDWLDAAIAISADESRSFAPILGTGGNEGRLDYTNNFMENVANLLISPDKKTPVRALLEHALFDVKTIGLQDIAVGQYDPGRSGGANQGNGISSTTAANPWNAVLTVEGAIAWAGGIYRKQGISYRRSFLCSPFTVNPSVVGYGSAADKDESTARAEIWTPLWDKAARYGEIRSLFREGRAAIGGKAASTGLEFAEAATSLGVDRAISAFVRYSLVKRRGDSYIALPAGRFRVEYRSTADRVREMAPFLERANRAAKYTQTDAPNSWPPLARAMEEAMFSALLRGGEEALIDMADALGAMHRWLLLRGHTVFWPRKLEGAWVEQLSERAEGRIAAAMASFATYEKKGAVVDNLRPGTTDFSWVGRDLSARMLSTLRNRTLNAEAFPRGPFQSRRQALPSDVVAFLQNRLNEDLIETLLFACVMMDIPAADSNLGRNDVEECRAWPEYCVLKQLFAPEKVETPKGEVQLKPDLSVLTLLSAGRVGEATDVAIRRLRVSGLKPVIRTGRNSEDGARLGAALLIPVSGIHRLRSLVLDTKQSDLVAN